MQLIIPVNSPELDAIQVQLATVITRLSTINERLNAMATQAQVDAIGSAITTAVEQINAALTGVRADIDALKSQAAVDVSGLEARVADAQAAAQALTDLDVENPPPA
jgi:hypothetical protein